MKAVRKKFLYLIHASFITGRRPAGKGHELVDKVGLIVIIFIDQPSLPSPILFFKQLVAHSLKPLNTKVRFRGNSELLFEMTQERTLATIKLFNELINQSGFGFLLNELFNPLD